MKGSTILDAEVVCASKDGVPDFDALHSRTNDHVAVACAFDLLMLNGDDMRRKPFAERKAALSAWPVKKLDQGQKPESRSGHAGTLTCCAKATLLRKP